MKNVTQLSAYKVEKKFCKGFPPYLDSDALSHSIGMIVEWGAGVGKEWYHHIQVLMLLRECQPWNHRKRPHYVDTAR